ncbi:four helix bundle protein [Pseudomonas capeferrum]|uniref:four helix bundle protein n=1 Tax=Pseudomonas capeferrum TaxID=1495066 RepID=UPI0039792551
MYQAFADCRDFGFRSQITRAAVSVPSNITEGMERRGSREKTWFLSVAKASCAECGLN